MIEITKKSKCCGCEACSNICPKKCISMKEDEEGFRYPVVDKDKCINCGLCEKVCQYKSSVNEIETYTKPLVYSCVIKDKNNLKNSSTVAVFYNLAKTIIEEKGTIYGATYNENMEVIHAKVNNLNQLDKLRGSKYVQSTIGDMYSEVKNDLMHNKKVLFSGTPCQVGGLYKYLGKNHENLTTVDIICYGVPSPGIFKNYIEQCEKKNKSKIKWIDFRNKAFGWKNMHTKIDFEDDKIKYLKPSIENEWYKVFISHLSTRQCCHNCLYTSINRKADITLGDFWGIENIDDTIETHNGVGKVLLNTEKGKRVFDKIKSNYITTVRTPEDAIRINLKEPPKENPKRKEFFTTYITDGYEKAFSKFLKTNFLKKVLKKIGKFKR